MNNLITTRPPGLSAHDIHNGGLWERRPLVAVPLLAAAVFLAALTHLLVTRLTSQTLLLWPANAIALYVLLSSTPRRWLGYILAAVAGLGAAYRIAGDSSATAFVFAAGHSTEIFVAAIAIRSLPEQTRPGAGLTARLGAVSAVAIVASACSATIVSLFVTQTQGAPFGGMWIRRFTSDAISLLIVTPVLLRLTAERRHLKAEERVRLLAHALRTASDCISITDGDDRILYVNDAFVRTHGYDEHELIGRHIDLVRSAKNDPDVIDDIRPATRREGWRGVLWNRSKEGRTFPVFLATSTVHDDAGRFIAALSIARDVTDEHAAEDTLRASAEKFAKIFNISPDCIVISDAGPGGVLEVNERFEAITGLPRSAIIGHTITDLGVMVDPTTRGRWIEELRRSGSIRNWEYQVRRPTGEISTFIMSAESLELRGRQCFLSVHHDVTDTLRARDALHQTEAKYRALVENANDVIFMCDRDGQCLWMNRAGRDIAGAASGTHVSKLVAPEHAELVQSQLRRVIEGEDLPAFELDVINAQGRRITLELAVRAIYEGGVAVGVQGIARDVTDRKELEAQLRHAQKMQAVGALAGGVAHEFNNLLAALLGYADLAGDQVEPGSPVMEDLESIKRTARSAKSLTQQLLVFSRKDAGRPAILDLNDIVGQSEKMLRRIVGNQILFVVRLGSKLGQIRADASQIEQVIMNLVVNARDAMPAGGTLTVATDSVDLGESFVRSYPGLMAGPFIRLTVSDNGIGMTPDVQSQIFTPFFTTKGPSSGTGLGLATVHGIVHQADGCIVVESSPGQGTTFTMYFPQVAGPAETAMPEESPDGVTAGPETILFVEDDDGVRAIGARVLREYGYTVLSARHAEEAIALSHQFTGAIHILVTDIVMPGLDGRALFSHVRRTRQDLKVLFTSGYADDRTPRQIEDAGAPLLEKPYWPEGLVTAVRQVLHGSN